MIRIINLFVLFFLISACASKFDQKQNLLNNYFISINLPSNNRYNALLKYELNKINKDIQNNKKIISLQTDLNFSTTSTLSLNGLKPLYEMKGLVSYKLVDENNKVLDKGKLFSKINYGSVSSLYGKDQNKKFVKERIVKRLSLKLLNKIKLVLNKIENKS